MEASEKKNKMDQIDIAKKKWGKKVIALWHDVSARLKLAREQPPPEPGDDIG